MIALGVNNLYNISLTVAHISLSPASHDIYLHATVKTFLPSRNLLKKSNLCYLVIDLLAGVFGIFSNDI